MLAAAGHPQDRKSTRMNSSHQIISYAVFRLKKKSHAGLKARPAPTLSIIWNLRFFVQFSSHAVPDKFAHHIELVARRFLFNLRAYVAQPSTLMSHSNGAFQRPLRHPQQTFGALVNDAHRHRFRGIAHPALADDSDIEFHDIAILNSPLTGNSVNDFVV